MSAIVVDASVMIKCAVTESGSPSARSIVAEAEGVFAPELLLAECANALWKRVHRGLASRSEVSAALATLRDMPAALLPMRELTSLAFTFALEFDHPIYDCYYLAAVILKDCALATADMRLAGFATRAGLSDRVIFVS